MDKNGCTIFPESSGMDFEKLSENRVPLSGIKMDRKMSVETTAFVILHYGSQDVTDNVFGLFCGWIIRNRYKS